MGFETLEFPINDENKQEKESKYEAIEVLRNREYPTDFKYDKKGRLVLEDPDLKFIDDSINTGLKEGSLLTISADPDTIFRILPAATKIKDHSTIINFSQENNLVNTELLEASQNIGEQKVVEQSDIEVLKKLATVISYDKKYKSNYSGEELLSKLYDLSHYQGKPDIITADPIEQMDKIGSGEMLDGRTYDNIMLPFSLYTRSEQETLAFMTNLKQRLNKGGRVVLADVWEWQGVGGEDDFINAEPDIISEKYGNAWSWQPKQLFKVFEKAGLTLVNKKEKEIEESDEVYDAFEGYSFYTFEDSETATAGRASK
ncbi:MAG TPA: hypothetical protein DDW90_02825 [Cyanobacteria bacterium UBA9971]|nr:hypothetical protein [Cyanobacteria bacterium UBA9971]